MSSLHPPPPLSLSNSISLQTQNPPPPLLLDPTRSKRSWIESLRSLSRSNSFPQAITTFVQMQSSGVLPDNFAFPAILKAATALQDLPLGKQIHASVVKLGYDSLSVTVANTLLHMYGRCGDDVYQVFKVFDRIPQRDQVSWNSLINALCKFEEWELALEAFRSMGLESIDPSSFTLVSVALACSNLNRHDGLRLGKQVHGYTLRINEQKTFTNNSLMAMYAKLGRIDDAKIVSRGLLIVTWFLGTQLLVHFPKMIGSMKHWSTSVV
ncbi:Pentatricopeptide repeat-containing protein, chloroplastic [Sesamum angolense]|uniref:Pentatricopeptide repeat-containing protein, chloroplastic n=1 Tax=Sesamum angolense TaxID=2727404 RepID=A0AAE1WQF3_9LAMI|nr:Pentatricopeptide repeat-containing protein, chloroplastic [Sesamum angolense]